jgi:isoleucyl-tRNA synthetase
VWKSDDPRYPRVDVYGSLEELERDFGVRPLDLHRPMIDRLTRPNPDDPTGRATMRRVPEVLDCWFESGSMPFAQVHYPFENAEWFEHHYPGDFIVEYIGQTRGWFYTLHVLATALFDRPAFTTCMAHGIVLGNDGQKMSKSLRNYPDPYEMYDTYGADAMRWFLMSSAILRGSDLIVTEQGIRDAANQVIRPLWSAWHFYALYARAAGREGRFRTDQTALLDRYLLAKLHDLVAASTAAHDSYDLFAACAEVRAFLDVLTNWYIRRSRERFWEGEQDALDTLATALEVLCLVAAPLLPFVTDEVFPALTGRESVHLEDWPAAGTLPADPELVAAMDAVRQVVSAALGVRKARGLRVRLPLARLLVAAPDAELLRPFVDLVADEVNVKDVVLTADVAPHAEEVLQVVPAVCGPRLGPRTQDAIRAVKAGDWSLDPDGGVRAGDIRLEDGEYTLRLVPADGDRSAPLPGHRGVVVLDTDVTPDLEAEGIARDVVRVVQGARKDAGLDVSDRIRLEVWGAPAVVEAVRRHQAFVSGEVLAVDLSVLPDGEAAEAARVGDDLPVGVRVTKA